MDDTSQQGLANRLLGTVLAKVKYYWPWLVVCFAGAFFLILLICHVQAESLWFESLGYVDVFQLQLKTRIVVWTIVLILSCGVWGGNFWLAQRSQQHCILPNQPQPPDALNLKGLLFSVAILSLGISVLLYHQISVVSELWRTEGDLPREIPGLPPILGWPILSRIALDWWQQPYWLFLVMIISIGISLIPIWCLSFVGLLLSLGLGFNFNQEWARLLASLNPTLFDQLDPLFHQDISFYVFEIPLLKLIRFWSLDIFAFTFLGVLLLYLVADSSLSRGYFVGFSDFQKRHLSYLACLFFLALAYGYGLACFGLLYSSQGITYGAGYVDHYIQLPVKLILIFIALILSFICGCSAFRPELLEKFRIIRSGQKRPWNGSILRISVLVFCGFSLFAEQLLPIVVQRVIVEPNEIDRELTYIRRSIAATRSAFGLDMIEARTFNPVGNLLLDEIRKSTSTLENIRLWDSRPLLETNRQLQQIRLYYSFPDADIDRYNLINPEGDIFKQQVLVAARELDYNAVPQEAQTWVNEHLIYTHGYGFTLSPVNTIGDGGLPDYFIKDIGSTTSGNSTLDITSDAVRASIPVGEPRIYYGALTNTYIMTSTRVPELDYPSGNDNVYTIYQGRGGVSLNSWWRRFLFAVYLKDWQMFLTRNFTPETKVLFRRSVKDRIQAIAPFLSYDQDPYLVIANADLKKVDGKVVDSAPPEGRQNRNYLYWMIDAYTTTELYPYSDPGTHPYNYIRNSVKVVMDAYHGSVTFYVADPNDPLIQTWTKLFPSLFKPYSEMPIALQSHVRYPSHLFNVQSERLLTYHMTDPQVFYNREDQWQIPQEIYAGEQQQIEAYYLITHLPKENSDEFILLTPFTPVGRSNLVAWLAGRSDGINYGRLLLYQFPKERLIYGPEQIEARINQDPVISQQISLWNRQGSKAIQGNLLVIPLEQSLLYVEPLYLEADQNSLPTLVRVIMAYENRIVMAPTLEEALQELFKPDPEGAITQDALPPAIVRPLEEAG